MRARDHDEVIPPWAAGLGGGLMILALAITAYLTAVREPAPPGAPVTAAAMLESRDILLTPREGGGVAVADAADGAAIATLSEQEGGFIRGVLRVLTRERMLSQIDTGKPFRLAAYADGRLSITDPETGRVIDINAFGPTQAEAFAALL